MKVIQLAERLEDCSDIGAHIILIHHLLEQAGYAVETRVGTASGRDAEAVVLPCEGALAGPEDILILHFRGGGRVARSVPGIPCWKVLAYYGVPSSELFWGYDYAEYQAAMEGEQMVRRWAREQRFDAVLAFSKHHYQELISFGFPRERTFLLPGYLMSPQLQTVEPDSDVLEDFCDGVTTILSVGQIMPHNKQQEVLQAFAYLQRIEGFSARLIIAGSGRNTVYGEILKKYCIDAGIKHVFFIDQLSPAELAALYQSAAVLVRMSEMEELDMQLIYAIWKDVPVLSYGTETVQEMMLDSGVVLHRKDTLQTALWMKRIAEDAALQSEILKSQRIRRKALNHIDPQKEFLDFMRDFIFTRIKKNQNTGDIGSRIDETIYNFCSLNMSRIGAQMPMSCEEYLSSVRTQ